MMLTKEKAITRILTHSLPWVTADSGVHRPYSHYSLKNYTTHLSLLRHQAERTWNVSVVSVYTTVKSNVLTNKQLAGCIFVFTEYRRTELTIPHMLRHFGLVG